MGSGQERGFIERNFRPGRVVFCREISLESVQGQQSPVAFMSPIRSDAIPHPVLMKGFIYRGCKVVRWSTLRSTIFLWIYLLHLTTKGVGKGQGCVSKPSRIATHRIRWCLTWLYSWVIMPSLATMCTSPIA